MWTMTEGQDVRIHPEEIPEPVMKQLCRETLKAVRRFYEIPENRAAFEAWKAERDTQKEAKGHDEQS